MLFIYYILAEINPQILLKSQNYESRVVRLKKRGMTDGHPL